MDILAQMMNVVSHFGLQSDNQYW